MANEGNVNEVAYLLISNELRFRALKENLWPLRSFLAAREEEVHRNAKVVPQNNFARGGGVSQRQRKNGR